MSETTVITAPVTETARVNKSSLIRDAFKKLGSKATANDVINTVKEASGVEVNDSLVNVVRNKLKSKNEAKKKARAASNGKPAETTTVAAPVAPVVAVQTEDPLLMVRDLARKLGGLAALKNAIARLEELAV